MDNQFDYSQYTADAEVTAKESYRIKDGSGGKGIFRDELMTNIPQYKPSVGIKVIDIVMARAGQNHPLVVAGKLHPDQMTHICWAYVHKNIGPGQDWFICLAKTYGQPCPVCEHRSRLQNDTSMDEAQIKAAITPFYSGRYPLGIYNIVLHSNPNQITWQEPEMVWTINNSFMESTLQSMAKQPMVSSECPTGYVNYMYPTAGPQGGRHIKFEVKMKGQYFDYDGHTFITRQAPIPPHVMQGAYCLSELLYVPEYGEVKDALEAGLGQPVGGQPTGGAYTAEYGQPTGGQPPVFGTPGPVCPFAEYEGVYGVTFDKFEDCGTCQLAVQCQGMSAPPPVQQPVQTPAPTPRPTPPPGMAAGTPPPGIPTNPPHGAPIPRRAPR